MYSLAKQFDKYGFSKDGSDNWLSGFDSSKVVGIGGIAGAEDVATPPGTSTTDTNFEVQKEKIVEKKR